MARVDVMLNGRVYPVACENGQEARLSEIAAQVDGRMRQISSSSPGISETRLLVLTALLLADEVLDLRLNRPTSGAKQDVTVAEAVDQLSKRLEDLAVRLEQA